MKQVCTEEHFIVVENISKTFPSGVKALDNFSLCVHRSEVVVIIGPSGSGKSTFLRCLNGLEDIDSGRIVIDDILLNHDHRNLLAIRTEVGMVFQSFNLFPHLTVKENINLAQRLVRRKSRKEATDTTMALLEKVGMTEKANTFPNHLSGGQQQRVAIARALAMRPKVMLFDEATSALDPELVKGVLALMTDLSEQGMTMIMVTHEMGYARDVSDHVVFMDEGMVVETGAPEQIFTDARSDRLKTFLSQIL